MELGIENNRNYGYLVPSALSAKLVLNLTIKEEAVDTIGDEVSLRL